VVAIADLFPDNLAAGRARFDKINAGLGRAPIDERLLFHGPHAFEQLVGSTEVDLIQISTPPFFHVDHLARRCSGKHVYCEKPVGIDVKQAKHALDIGRRVTPAQSVDVGFQCRSAPPLAAARTDPRGALARSPPSPQLQRSRSTEKIRAGEGRTSTGCATGCGTGRSQVTSWSSRTSTHRSLQLAAGARPLKATATGGRNILTHFGDCWDNYQVDFTYLKRAPVVLVHAVRDRRAFDAGLKLYGSNGLATLPYSGRWRLQAKRHGLAGSGARLRKARQLRANSPPMGVQ